MGKSLKRNFNSTDEVINFPAKKGVIAFFRSVDNDRINTYRFILKDSKNCNYVSSSEEEKNVRNLIKFMNASSNSHSSLIIRSDKSIYQKYIIRLVCETNSRFICVSTTNTRWAETYESAKTFIDKLYMAFKFNVYGPTMEGSALANQAKNTNPHSIFRLLVFVDSFTDEICGMKQICNIINVFRCEYSNAKYSDFKLRIHVVESGKSYELDKLARKLKCAFKIDYSTCSDVSYNESGNIEGLPHNASLSFVGGYSIEIGLSGVIDPKRFYQEIDNEAKNSILYAFPDIITFNMYSAIDFMTLLS